MFSTVLLLFMIFTTVGSIGRKLEAAVRKYEPKPRDLPSDLFIVTTFLTIKDPALRRMFAIMAVFGLRNHEVLTADLSPLLHGEHYIIVQEDTKTGAREAWALYPEWIELFGLLEEHEPFVLPKNPTRTALGTMVTKAFTAGEIPFNAYNLRHAWARRSVGSLDARHAAISMGHSLIEHYKTYNRWFTFLDMQRAYQKYLDDPKRIHSPEIPNL